MKVYISGYRSHWISPYKIMEKIIFWREIDYDEPFIEKCNKVLEPFCNAWMKFLDFIHPKIEYVKIDRYDTWSMDHTLAHIILPMLKQLRDESHGSPWVEDEDVPAELCGAKKRKSKIKVTPEMQSLSDDEMIHKRWKWVLDEMIWAFEQKMLDDAESQFFDYSDTDEKKMPWHEDYVGPKVDWDGLNAHNARKQNAFRLFGKYYENLWD